MGEATPCVRNDRGCTRRLGEVVTIRSWLRSVKASYVALIFLGALMACGPARANKRIALVIGNSAYQHVVRLENPSSDARLMAKTLRGLGFTLVGGSAQTDLDKSQFDRAVQMFRNAAHGADVALFYYAGHGMQMHNENYLVPVDADLKTQADVDFQMLDTDLVLRQMETAHARLNIMILDACRNNPFRGQGARAIGGGLAQMQAPEGTLISFATQPGNVALDGRDGHSPFTRALTKVMRRPGLDIFRTFNQVGVMVSRATDKQQQPWLSSSPINGDFYFAGVPKAPQPSPTDEQRRRFSAAKQVGTKEAWGLFLRTYKTGYYADLARAERDKIVALERAKAADEKRAMSEAAVHAKVAALQRAQQEAAAASAKKTLEKVQRETAAAKAAQEAAKAAQQAAEKAARELQLAIAKAAKEAAAKADRELQAHTRNKVAALAPPATESPPGSAPILSPTDLVRLLKVHLRDVGCDPGDDNGEWDVGSRRALENFNKFAGTHLDVKTPSVATLDAIDAKHGRVCPLVCGRGTRRQGDQCVAITCKKGYALRSDGTCHRMPQHRKTVSAPSYGGSSGPGKGMHNRYKCKHGNLGACRILCSHGHQKACHKADRLSGLRR